NHDEICGDDAHAGRATDQRDGVIEASKDVNCIECHCERSENNQANEQHHQRNEHVCHYESNQAHQLGHCKAILGRWRLPRRPLRRVSHTCAIPTPTSRWATIGRLLPSTRRGSTLSTRTTPCTTLLVASPIRMVSGSAASRRCDATVTGSPTAVYSGRCCEPRKPTTTSPGVMPAAVRMAEPSLP